MATTAGRGVDVRAATWSPARVYLAVSGVFLVVAAAVGFGLSTAFPFSAAAVGSGPHIFGVFETNGWHNLAAVVSGAMSLGFAAQPQWARLGALVKGTMYVAVTVSIAVWGPETFLIASNTADQVVHGSLGAAGLAAWLATPRRG